MGSLVAPDRLRFDYAISTPPAPEQLAEIERLVNEAVLRDTAVSKEVMAMEDARRKGADMFFGEKYGERVRVVSVPGESVELCGGCHVNRTGEIGAFKIVSDKGLAAGVRRMEAVTSLGAVELLRQDEQTLTEMAAAAQAPREALVSRWVEREERVRALEREVASLKLKLASGDAGGGGGDSVDVDGVRLVTRIAGGLSIPGAAKSVRHAAVEDEERRRCRRDLRRGQDLGRRGGDSGPVGAGSGVRKSPRGSARRSAEAAEGRRTSRRREAATNRCSPAP